MAISAEDRIKIKSRIEAEIAKTKLAIEDYTQLSKPIAPDDAIGRVSRMDAINNKSVAEAGLTQAKMKLADLEYVQSEIDKPNFGNCIKCKNPIPIARIMYMPQSRHCVNCAR